jgi:hypothetical protein
MGSNNRRSISSSRKIGYIFAIFLSPIFILFAIFGEPERGFFLMCLAGALLTICYVRREIIKKQYFLIVVITVFIIEGSLLIFLPIPNEHFPGVIIMPIAIANVIVVLAILRIIEKFHHIK